MPICSDQSLRGLRRSHAAMSPLIATLANFLESIFLTSNVKGNYTRSYKRVHTHTMNTHMKTLPPLREKYLSKKT